MLKHTIPKIVWAADDWVHYQTIFLNGRPEREAKFKNQEDVVKCFHWKLPSFYH